MSRLVDVLAPMRNVPDTTSKAKNIEEIVLYYVNTFIQSGQPLEGIKQQLVHLHRDELLFPDEVLKKALALAEKESKAHTAGTKPTQTSGSQPKEPLFSKDTVYHADICCRVLAEGDAGNYQSLFKKLPNGQGHSFTSVSMSRSKTERLLIAEQGDSLIYFAFESRPQLSDWKGYKSFNEGGLILYPLIHSLLRYHQSPKGITQQSQQFPVRYIVELLNKQYRIVLTGESCPCTQYTDVNCTTQVSHLEVSWPTV